MDTLLSMRVFQSVVDQQSFTGAAQQLDLSKAMVSKHIMHLEQHLGARLLNRNSRHLSLTESGRLYLQRCRNVLEDIAEVESLLANANVSPRGEIKLSAPLWIANTQFMGLLHAFQQQHPEVTFDIDISGRFVDIVEEGFDSALRASRTLNPNLIARHLTQMPFKVVATSEYLSRHKHPQHPSELSQLALLSYSLVDNAGLIRLNGPMGQCEVQMNPVLSSNNEFILYQAACQGMGVGILPEGLIQADIEAGRLIELLPEYRTLEQPLYAVYASRRYLSLKVRLFIDYLAQHMNQHTPYNN